MVAGGGLFCGLGRALALEHVRHGGDVILVARGHGRVLNVASAAAWFPGPEQATYFATKAYLAALSNALWYELKPLGIRMTTLLHGPIETGFAQAGQLAQPRLFAPGTGVAP